MIKNRAGQVVSFLMLDSSGAAVTTGTPVVYYTIEGGTQQVGGGTAAHEGNGEWSYQPLKAETNGDQISWLMTLSGAVSRQVNVWPLSQSEVAAATTPVVTSKNLGDLRSELATRLGFGGMSGPALNQDLLNSFLIRAQEDLWRRVGYVLMKDRVDKWVAPGESGIAYPSELDPLRISEIRVDYDGNGHWYPLTDGIGDVHESTDDTETWPRRYETQYDQIDLWPTIGSSSSVTITDITKANPAVVTAAGHGLVDGQRIRISDVGGMTEITDGVYTVDAVTTDTFELHDENDDPVDSTSYTTFTTGGTVTAGYKLRFEGQRRLSSFENDADYPSLPEDLVFERALIFGKAHYRHQDYQALAAQHERRIQLIKGASHGNKRMLPDKRGRSRREAIRPVMVS